MQQLQQLQQSFTTNNQCDTAYFHGILYCATTATTATAIDNMTLHSFTYHYGFACSVHLQCNNVAFGYAEVSVSQIAAQLGPRDQYTRAQ